MVLRRKQDKNSGRRKMEEKNVVETQEEQNNKEELSTTEEQNTTKEQNATEDAATSSASTASASTAKKKTSRNSRSQTKTKTTKTTKTTKAKATKAKSTKTKTMRKTKTTKAAVKEEPSSEDAKESGKKQPAEKTVKKTEEEKNLEDQDPMKDIPDPEDFQTRLEKLINQAKKNGDVLDYKEVVHAFSDLELEDEKYDLITSYLESKGIDVLNFEDDQEEEKELEEEVVEDEDVPDEELELIEQEERDNKNGSDEDLNLNSDSVNIEDPVRMYLKEIGKVPLLTADEEVAIAKRMENGNIAKKMLEQYFSDVPDDNTERVTTENEFLASLTQEQKQDAEEKKPALLGKNKQELQAVVDDGKEAKNKLSEANLRLVVSIAKRYVGRGMLFLDLIQEGNLGLIKAVEKFDYRKGFKFSTYATWWIRQAITRAIADQARTIRIPVHMVETINKLVRVSRQLLQELGREPTPEEIAERMNIPVERVREIIKISQEPVSLETPIGEEEDSHLGDFIQDENVPVPADAAAYTLLKEQLQEVLSTLTEREQKVLRLRFGLDDGRARTLEEVGKEFNVTRERIRQIEAKALRKLRHPSRSRKLKDYLD